MTGPVGAGKTTVSIDLSHRLAAVRFSIDEWMMQLFAPDLPEPVDPLWMLERVRRCYDQITATAIRVADVDTDVVLDLGFTTVADRAMFADRIRAAGHAVKLYWLDLPPGVRWLRVQERNRRKDAGYAFPISRGMFDFVEERYEPPSSTELLEMNGEAIPHGGRHEYSASA